MGFTQIDFAITKVNQSTMEVTNLSRLRNVCKGADRGVRWGQLCNINIINRQINAIFGFVIES